METSIGSLNDLGNSTTSLAPESYTENHLVTDINTEIKEIESEVREEVCPMCGKKYRIGDLQKFRDIYSYPRQPV